MHIQRFLVKDSGLIAGSIIAFFNWSTFGCVRVSRNKKANRGERNYGFRAIGIYTRVSQFHRQFCGIVYCLLPFQSDGSLNRNTNRHCQLLFKFIVAIALTPLLYLIHGVIDSYLGDSLASELKNAAKA